MRLFFPAQTSKTRIRYSTLSSQPRKHKLAQFLAARCPWNKPKHWWWSHYYRSVLESSLRPKHRTIWLHRLRSGVNYSKLQDLDTLISPNITRRDPEAVNYRHQLARRKARWKKDILVRLITQHHGLCMAFKLHLKRSFSRGFIFPQPYGCDTA